MGEEKNVIVLENEWLRVLLENDRSFLSKTLWDKNRERNLELLSVSEFCVQLGAGNDTRLIDAADCVLEAEKQGETAVYRYRHACFTVEITYSIEQYWLLKRLRLIASEELFLKRLHTDCAEAGARPQRGGEGQPIFLGDAAFAGIEFPASYNEIEQNRVLLRQAPYLSLGAGESFEAFPIVYGLNASGNMEKSFLDYILARSPFSGRKLKRIYCDWGLHDELSDNKGLDCDMALQAVDTIEQIRKQGFSFDYYLMDAFWFEPDQPYTTFKESSFPQGITPLLERLDQCGMKFGLWFDVNFAHEHLSGYRALRRDRSDNQQLCFSQPETAKMMENALLKHVRESRIKMIKFDFAYFECCNSAHQNHSGEHLESKEPAIRNFINVLDKVRREEPEMTVLAYNGFTAGLEWIGSVYERRQGYAISPWWCLYIDYLYCGDPRPADFAADLLNHSITAYTDAMIYQFRQALIPFEFIDDHGSMVASTATMYWLRRRGMRDYLLMNVMRTTCKIHFYGDIHEVTHEDVDFLKWCNEKALDIETKQMHNSFILGNPLRGEVYGYSITNGREGYIVLSNPTGEVRRSLLSLDEWQHIRSVKLTRIYSREMTEEQPCGIFEKGEAVTAEPYSLTCYHWERADHKERLTEFTIGPGETVHLTIPPEAEHLSLCLLREDGTPYRFPDGFPEGLTADFSGCKASAAENLAIWSGISWRYYTITEKQKQSELTLRSSFQERLRIKIEAL